MLGTFIRQGYQRLLQVAATPMTANAMDSTAMVFAPHPDDETLGCGGTIILKRRRGVEVSVVVMTDGAASHAGRAGAENLRKVRLQEVQAAAATLGVTGSALKALAFPDGRLGLHRADAVACVVDLLNQKRPRQVFVPCSIGEHPDHVSTNEIVWAALWRTDLRPQVLEYPIWLWRHLPAVAPIATSRGVKATVGRSISAALSLRMFELRTAVTISSVLDQKRLALSRHASQTRRPHDAPDWPVLDDVDGGTFIECFFQGVELFRQGTMAQALGN